MSSICCCLNWVMHESYVPYCYRKPTIALVTTGRTASWIVPSSATFGCNWGPAVRHTKGKNARATHIGRAKFWGCKQDLRKTLGVFLICPNRPIYDLKFRTMDVRDMCAFPDSYVLLHGLIIAPKICRGRTIQNVLRPVVTEAQACVGFVNAAPTSTLHKFDY